MIYKTEKKVQKPPKQDPQLKVLKELKETVELSLTKPVKVETVIKESPGTKDAVNRMSNLLVTSIKQNQEIVRVHAAQMNGAIAELQKAEKPVKKNNLSFRMDVHRGNDGYISYVDGTIKE